MHNSDRRSFRSWPLPADRILRMLSAKLVPVREHPAGWTVVVTLCLLPLSSMLFLAIFDPGSDHSWALIIFFPVLIVWYQGALVGLITNTILIACTYLPIYLVISAMTKHYATSQRSNSQENRDDCGVSIPLRLRLLASFDFIAAAGTAGAAIDYPLMGLCVLSLFWPVAVGLWMVRNWGWWLGIIVHSILAGVAMIAYLVAMIGLAADLGRPRGHMELVSIEVVMIGLSIALVAFGVVASVPIWILLSERTRHAFRESTQARVRPLSESQASGFGAMRTAITLTNKQGWPRPLIGILAATLLVAALPPLIYLIVVWAVGGWSVR